ncbi:hypothetical protein EV702DRAFT_538635 [Suillus placidus]|uniref:Transmembrane protein n=1 Tax=Suillus placidus TaxID=48579 RepID=A0A9P7D0Q3_9AGAM|nr:hypothetical protein EV702DRAFT_538635 [Suillus placidus]
MTRSKNPSENESGSFSARTCYVLHGMLIMIHIVLVISYIFRWEHRVTLPFTPMNTDFWPVVLSASLQALYTFYTAVLVFLTQRLAMSRALVRRLKLTAIHDIFGAWAGLGSALSSVWKQAHIPASLWATTAVTTYLVCISVLHVTSSTLLQFQTFNSSMTTRVSTTLGWVDVSNPTVVEWTIENWGAITASLPVISQFPGLVSTGLSSNTVYDIPRTSSVVGYATVNATTITSSCGLLPNVTYSWNNNAASAPSVNGSTISMTAPPPWADQIQVLQLTGTTVQGADNFAQLPAVLLMVSTLLEIEPSVQKEVAVPMFWKTTFTNQSMEVYFMQCSLSTSNTTVVIDTQTNTLQNPLPVPQPSTQWQEMPHQWTSTEWSIYIGQVLAASGASDNRFMDAYGHTSAPSFVDEYIMSLVGLNLTAQYNQWANDDPPVSNFTLSPNKLEAAVAQTVAQLTWMGRMGSNGGIQPGEGMALVDEEVIALRLNITLLPLMFATSASVIMLGLALHTTGAFYAPHDSQAPISNVGALQLLWLGRHSASVHEALRDVDDPTEANLRRAGMIDICFSSTTSDEEELPTGSLIDSLSVQESTVCDDGISY